MEGRPPPASQQVPESPAGEEEYRPSQRLPWLLLMVAVVAIASLAISLRSAPETVQPPHIDAAVLETPRTDSKASLPDSDGDGLPDVLEESGWRTGFGAYRTDPLAADTDGDGLTDGEEAGPFQVNTGSASLYAGVSDPTKADSDDDGLDDRAEVLGWTTQRGAHYLTEPMNPDTDADGLTDGDEAGNRQTSVGPPLVYSGVSDPTKADSDDDGLDDKAEVLGWTTRRGVRYLTEPMNPDTDSDGLTDRDEAGLLVLGATPGFSGLSSPLVVDTDRDGLDDAGEADLGLDAYDSDTDDDGLEDGYEAYIVGSSPLSPDTDGDGFLDGFEDANRETQGLDPLWFDEKVGTWDYAIDFAKGAVAGDLWRGDSTAWLLGNLASGGASFIPGVGWIVGSVADVRDAVGSAIHADWVGAGYSAVGLVPEVGDAVAIPAKVSRFVIRHPELAEVVGATVVALKNVPDDIKVKATRPFQPNWDDLAKRGANDKTLLRLQGGKTSLTVVSTSMQRPTHIRGRSTPFFADGFEAEAWLERNYRRGTRQSAVRTDGCAEVCNATNLRVVDVLANGIAHESKVGYTSLTDPIRRQIMSDAYLIKNGAIDGAHWHFFASGHTNTLGPSSSVVDLLVESGISYTIHLPVQR